MALFVDYQKKSFRLVDVIEEFYCWFFVTQNYSSGFPRNQASLASLELHGVQSVLIMPSLPGRSLQSSELKIILPQDSHLSYIKAPPYRFIDFQGYKYFA